MWSRTDLVTYNGSFPVAEGIVIFSNNSTTYALNAATGATRWTYPESCSSASYANGVFWLACGALTPVNAQTGAVLGRFGIRSGSNGPPVIANGEVFVTPNYPQALVVALDTAGATR